MYTNGEFGRRLYLLLDSLNDIDVPTRDVAIEQVASMNLQTIHVIGEIRNTTIDAFAVISQVEILRENPLVPGLASGFRFRTLAGLLGRCVCECIDYDMNGSGSAFVGWLEDDLNETNLIVDYFGQLGDPRRL